jgi:hypothetical protein
MKRHQAAALHERWLFSIQRGQATLPDLETFPLECRIKGLAAQA